MYIYIYTYIYIYIYYIYIYLIYTYYINAVKGDISEVHILFYGEKLVHKCYLSVPVKI